MKKNKNLTVILALMAGVALYFYMRRKKQQQQQQQQQQTFYQVCQLVNQN